jgi:hypothetical protein
MKPRKMYAFGTVVHRKFRTVADKNNLGVVIGYWVNKKGDDYTGYNIQWLNGNITDNVRLKEIEQVVCIVVDNDFKEPSTHNPRFPKQTMVKGIEE